MLKVLFAYVPWVSHLTMLSIVGRWGMDYVLYDYDVLGDFKFFWKHRVC